MLADFDPSSWRVIATALALPPVPLLLLVLMGAAVLRTRRVVGWLLLWLAIALLWLSACVGVGEWLMRTVLQPPPALNPKAVAELRHRVAQRLPLAIIVLGAGREARAPEYGTAIPNALSLERLRYGVWLGRQTGAPVGFSGGLGPGSSEGPAEADVAAKVAGRDFDRPLRWIENESRNTRENAARTVRLLKPDGIEGIVLVTHAWHMPRARRAFEDAVRNAGMKAAITPAPIAWAPRIESPVLRWLPSTEGYALVRQTLREALGLIVGA